MTEEKLKALNELNGTIKLLTSHYSAIEEAKPVRQSDERFFFDPGSGLPNVYFQSSLLPITKELFFTMYLANVKAEIERLEKEFETFQI